MKNSISHALTPSGKAWCGKNINPKNDTYSWIFSNCIKCLKAGEKHYGPKYDFFSPLIKKLEEDLKSMKFDKEIKDFLS